MTITIFHNPACGTSRNVLAMIRNSGVEPRIVNYLQAPPGREKLVELLAAMCITPRQLLRRKGTPYDELRLDDPAWTDDELIDFMVEHPILMNRPIVATPLGTRLCSPLGERARHPAVATACGVCQGRRRGGHRREGPPCRHLTCTRSPACRRPGRPMRASCWATCGIACRMPMRPRTCCRMCSSKPCVTVRASAPWRTRVRGCSRLRAMPWSIGHAQRTRRSLCQRGRRNRWRRLRRPSRQWTHWRGAWFDR